MCGICGIYGLRDETNVKQKISVMTNRLQHRGPDDEGIYVNTSIALGHRRLSIIDLSAAGHQPMYSPDKRYCIVYNGELYNYKELKLELQRVSKDSNHASYFFQTNTDTEVILAAYIRWGNECLKLFNGMFAFAIWDNQKEELFVARDRIGIKPLYYLYTNGVFAFASEIRSLLASQLIPAKIDTAGLIDYLRYQTVHAPRTLVKGVKMLLPGNYISVAAAEVKIKSYWKLRAEIDNQTNKDYKEICNDVNGLLTKAVERRLIADVPFGAFLSGGIDSSAIVALMHKVAHQRVKTFSVTFDESQFSEAAYATRIAKKFNTDHHEIKLKPDDFLKELPAALNAMDHPSGDGANTYIVSKATKEAGITMALSGLGGDELFGGYDVFKRVQALHKKKWIAYIPQLARSAAGTILKNVKKGISSDKIAEFLKQENLNFNSFYTLNRQVLLDYQIATILSSFQNESNAVTQILEGYPLPVQGKNISTVSIAEISTYMQNVLLRDTDQMSMAHALEVRVPFLDYTLVEYVLNLPDHYKQIQTPKKLLVDALGDLLPDEIVNRPKMGFVFPWQQWMKKELKSFCEEKLFRLGKRKEFEESGINRMWKSFLNNDPKISWSRIWILVVLENWLEKNGIEA